jgi:hypothetical protein
MRFCLALSGVIALTVAGCSQSPSPLPSRQEKLAAYEAELRALERFEHDFAGSLRPLRDRILSEQTAHPERLPSDIKKQVLREARDAWIANKWAEQEDRVLTSRAIADK